MSKNMKVTIEKLASMVAKGFANMATKNDIANMATKNDIANMATKNDLKGLATKIDLENVERRLSAKIESVDEKIDVLEEVDIRGLQHRVSVLEKDVRQIKHKHV